MTQATVDKIVQAVLYEGYMLYPYRPSLKNRQRWTIGGLYPRAYAEALKGSDAWQLQTQCIVVGKETAALHVTVRFLHLTNRTVSRLASRGTPAFTPAGSLDVDGLTLHPWQEATERTTVLGLIPLRALLAGPAHRSFAFPPSWQTEPVRNAAGQTVGLLTREQRPINGSIELGAERIGPDQFRVTVRVSNLTASAANPSLSRDDALMRSLASAHAILTTAGGQFVSMTDPPEPLRQAAAECRNVGCWPVLVGAPGQTDTLLASPIILYDYPQIAPESPGDLFDATEIDEILSLRIMTLTDAEKQQAAAVDPRVSALLARTESLAREQLMNLHGTVRGLRPVQPEGHHA